jgi:drug/metabolite transporter (DMT)-like permease
MVSPARTPSPSPDAGPLLPALALVLNAFVWGISWWPFRQLQGAGLHPLVATALVYLLSVILLLAVRPRAWRAFANQPLLWLLAAAAGMTNVGFNWAVTMGDVVRVVLLFYLMPLWAVLLARWLLGEPLTRRALLCVGLALCGALIVLWPSGGLGTEWPLPRTLPEWLAVLGGWTFALNNVLLRREAGQPQAARALAMFLGGAAVSGAVATALMAQGTVPAPPALAPGWLLGSLAMATAFLAGNMALQFGAGRLPAHVTAVVMITEVLFASVSAVVLGAGELTAALVLGGSLIVTAAVISSRG